MQSPSFNITGWIRTKTYHFILLCDFNSLLINWLVLAAAGNKFLKQLDVVQENRRYKVEKNPMKRLAACP